MHGLIRVCYDAGGDLAALRVGMLQQLRKLVSFDAAFMAASDPETLLFTAVFADEPLIEAGPLFLDNEFGVGPDVNRFSVLAAAADPVASLDAATGGERNASSRSREIMTPLGMGDEARVALRVAGTTWGFLCLHRNGPTGFDTNELARLRRAVPHMAEAVRRHAGLAAEVGSPSGDAAQGLVIVIDDRVAALGGEAEYWLERLGGGPVTVGGPLPLQLLVVTRRLVTLERSGSSGPPPVVRLATTSGALVTVRATRLRDASSMGPIALAIAPAGSGERASLLLAAHGLTPAQRRVARLVLQGSTTRQIVVALHISEHTVQDHLKAVFDKLGVRSRRELVAAVMRPAG
jgi:DNA-binding CsgD family transcriptional regulator